jgi:hypothetical protein
VQDTGCGIPPENQPHIWGPFFTTTEGGEGTGLGLATVRGVVAAQGGFITLDSTVGEGTTFRVYLSAHEASQPGAETEAPAATGGAGQLVLVVDDEESIREIGSVVLESAGYRVRRSTCS